MIDREKSLEYSKNDVKMKNDKNKKTFKRVIATIGAITIFSGIAIFINQVHQENVPVSNDIPSYSSSMEEKTSSPIDFQSDMDENRALIEEANQIDKNKLKNFFDTGKIIVVSDNNQTEYNIKDIVISYTGTLSDVDSIVASQNDLYSSIISDEKITPSEDIHFISLTALVDAVKLYNVSGNGVVNFTLEEFKQYFESVTNNISNGYAGVDSTYAMGGSSSYFFRGLPYLKEAEKTFNK